MKWSWRIGRVFGVDLYMHATFLLLLIWVAYWFYSQRGFVADAVSGLIFIVLLFTIVVLHEPDLVSGVVACAGRPPT